jgi:predicted nucleic acid-binding protein
MPTLDTSFLIDLIRQKPEAMVKINGLIEAGIPLATTTINDDTYEAFGALSADQRRDENSIGEFDELIASITLCNDGIIITHDRHFLQVPGLKVEMY